MGLKGLPTRGFRRCVTLASNAYVRGLPRLATRSQRTTSGREHAGSPPWMIPDWRCVLPGTELAFAGEVACLPTGRVGWKTKTINHQTAIFRQVDKDKLAAHHDTLEFPDGRTVLLTLLCEGQAATVLQLPAQSATTAEADEHEARYPFDQCFQQEAGKLAGGGRSAIRA